MINWDTTWSKMTLSRRSGLIADSYFEGREAKIKHAETAGLPVTLGLIQLPVQWDDGLKNNKWKNENRSSGIETAAVEERNTSCGFYWVPLVLQWKEVLPGVQSGVSPPVTAAVFVGLFGLNSASSLFFNKQTGEISLLLLQDHSTVLLRLFRYVDIWQFLDKQERKSSRWRELWIQTENLPGKSRAATLFAETWLHILVSNR